MKLFLECKRKFLDIILICLKIRAFRDPGSPVVKTPRYYSYDSNVVAFNIVLEVYEIVLISFNSFFFWIIFAILGPLHLYLNFSKNLLISPQKSSGITIFRHIALTLKSNLWRTSILLIFNLETEKKYHCIYLVDHCFSVTKSCQTLLLPNGPYNPPCSLVHGISQARILGWVVISFSLGFSQPRN